MGAAGGLDSAGGGAVEIAATGAATSVLRAARFFAGALVSMLVSALAPLLRAATLADFFAARFLASGARDSSGAAGKGARVSSVIGKYFSGNIAIRKVGP
jgi:hypothetical protein